MRLLVVCLLGVLRAQPLYDFASSSLVELTDETFDAHMVADGSALWVVEFYADWCGHCKQFAKGFEKAASNMQGLVKFGAVNADTAKATMQTMGVQGFPTVKIFLPEVARNPYTGKKYKHALEYKGPRTARGVVEFASGAIPSRVIQVVPDGVEAFASNGSLPKVLLFTTKPETTTLLKALALAFSGRLLIGETRADASSAAAADFGVVKYPSLYVLKPDGTRLMYDGELKPQALRLFLDQHADTDTTSGSADAAAPDQFLKRITASTFGTEVEPSKQPWAIFFTEDGTKPDGAEAFAESVFGQVSVAVGDAELAAKFDVGQAPAIVVLPFGTGAKTPKQASKFAAGEEATAAAKKAALESLPDNLVDRLDHQSVDPWIGGALSSSTAKAMCLLFSDKPEVPPLFRSLSMEFEGMLGFAMMPSSMMERFNVKKTPAVLVMFADLPAGGEQKEMQLQGMQFVPSMHGKFSFGNLANFVMQFLEQRRAALGGSFETGDDSGSAKPRQPKEEAPKQQPKDVGPIPELSAANFEQECTKRGGLCAIALLDGSADNANKEGHLQMLTKLRQKKAGGPLAFAWVDATCHTAFAAHFELSEMDLPTMVVLSPSKLRWARAIGAFDAETLGTFGGGVATGRVGTNPMQALPPLDEGVDCATINRGIEAVEDDSLGDEIMAEILEEERREREAREAELAAASAAGAASREAAGEPEGELSEIAKMEKELEECAAHDLLCMARREKQLKKIEKKRALEEKLKEIARKKKKKNKKKKSSA
jgi:protein disulfide-isomerase A6